MHTVQPSISILYAGAPSENVGHLERLCTFLTSAESVLACPISSRSVAAVANNICCLDLASIASEQSEADLRALAEALKATKAVLVFIDRPSPQVDQALSILTGDRIGAVRQEAPSQTLRFPRSGRRFSGELAGHVFQRGQTAALGLAHAPAAATPILETEAGTLFCSLEADATTHFVWSTPGVFDIHRPLRKEQEFEYALDQFIPIILFLRHAAGEACWHNPEASAGIVIDDPLLRRRYGYIDFPELLSSARQNGYHVTLAFIPWNYWRSRASEAALFRQHRDCFSLCVHGCDHNNREFGATDYGELLEKGEIAIARMDRHAQRVGLGYEPVFVCPQEQCSLEAWRAFADGDRFLAMVNTGCLPRNLEVPLITGADLLTPAQDSFFGFPVLKRHYWSERGLSSFALALALGKPAILVEHHEFFRDRCARAELFARQLRELNPSVRWDPLALTAQRTHWRRQLARDYTDIRFFTRRFILENGGSEPHRYRLRKRLGSEKTAERVLVNGSEIPSWIEAGYRYFEITASPRTTLQIALQAESAVPRHTRSRGWRYHAGVAARRGLSEIRDSFFARNAFALRTGRAAMTALGMTGRSQRRSRERIPS